MDEFAKMDVFFVVTTVAVVVVGLCAALVLYRLWCILGHVQRFAEELTEETALLRGDIALIREHMKDGFRLSKVVQLLRKLRRRSDNGPERD